MAKLSILGQWRICTKLWELRGQHNRSFRSCNGSYWHPSKPKEVLSRTEYQRYKKALNTFDNPVMIVTQDEVIEKKR